MTRARRLPAGSVTFLLTDIEASTALFKRLRDGYEPVLQLHHALVRRAIGRHGGCEVKTEGDAFLVSFADAADGLAAAVEIQRELRAATWPDDVSVRVRIGVHSGEAKVVDGDYLSFSLHQAARLVDTAHGGQIVVSEATAAACGQRLPPGTRLDNLGRFRLRDFDAPATLLQLSHTDLEHAFPAPRALPAAAHNLPIAANSFIGRERELAELAELRGTRRLVTLVGVGGAGKTRLAFEAGARAAEAFEDGVVGVLLASVTSAASVLPTIASSLGVPEQPGVGLQDAVTTALATRRVLLVLDNCEHVRSTVSPVVESVLAACPAVRVLATSRRPLGVPGEQVYPVPALEVPSAGAALESSIRSDSVRLFRERARLNDPSFEVTDDNAPAIARICRRLDGVPLALELAAARVQSLSLRELASRIDEAVTDLATTGYLPDDRQRSLTALVDWSYALLDDEERRVFRYLSVFSGGCTVAAAESVCASDHASRPTLDVLLSLVEHSVIVNDGSGRFRMLVVIAEYARTQLERHGEERDARSRHARYFAATAADVSRRLRGPEEPVALAQLEADHGNYESALGFMQREDDIEEMVRVVLALTRFWELRGHFTEGQRWLASALHGGDIDPVLRARAMFAKASFDDLLGDARGARDLCEAGLAACAEAADKLGLAEGHYALGHVLTDASERATCFNKALAMYDDLDDRAGVAACHMKLGLDAVYDLRDLDAAEHHYSTSLGLHRELGDKIGIAWSLTGLSDVARKRDDLDTFRRMNEECVDLRHQAGDKRGVAESLTNLGDGALRQGDLPSALALFEEALALHRQVGYLHGIRYSLRNLAGTLIRLGETSRPRAVLTELLQRATEQARDERAVALALTGVADLAIAEGALAAGVTLIAVAARLAPDTFDAPTVPPGVRESLGEPALTEAWSDGTSMPLSRAVTLALEHTRESRRA